MRKGPSHVFDSSAVMALLSGEPGCQAAEELLGGACISAVNLAEVTSSLGQRGLNVAKVAEEMEGLGLSVIPFDASHALRVGSLREITRALGLSLGDRACLATAESLGATAVTADRSWSQLKIGVEIQIIR